MAAATTLVFIICGGIARYFYIVCSTPFLADRLVFPADTRLILMCFLPPLLVAPTTLLDATFKQRRLLGIAGVGLLGLTIWLVPYLLAQVNVPDPSTTLFTVSMTISTLVSWLLSGTASVYVSEYIRERTMAK